MYKILTALVLGLSLTACGTLPGECGRDGRDRPWDPCPGHSLFEQLPNWTPDLEYVDSPSGPAAGDIVIRR